MVVDGVVGRVMRSRRCSSRCWDGGQRAGGQTSATTTSWTAAPFYRTYACADDRFHAALLAGLGLDRACPAGARRSRVVARAWRGFRGRFRPTDARRVGHGRRHADQHRENVTHGTRFDDFIRADEDDPRNQDRPRRVVPAPHEPCRSYARRMGDPDTWNAVDEYYAEALLPPDEALASALRESDAAGLPQIAVSPLQGALLELIARSMSATSVLEIGTLGGYSAIRLARGVGPDGRVLTLEYRPAHADVARRNISAAGLSDRVEVRVGAAIDLLPEVQRSGPVPFDLVFIDADKESNAAYVDWAIRLGRPGSVIIVDNVVHGGTVIDADSPSTTAQGTRSMVDRLRGDDRVNATAIQTVGVKGHDGFIYAVVR
jgi:predicted O-methyltransferase YrrM